MDVCVCVCVRVLVCVYVRACVYWCVRVCSCTQKRLGALISKFSKVFNSPRQLSKPSAMGRLPMADFQSTTSQGCKWAR